MFPKSYQPVAGSLRRRDSCALCGLTLESGGPNVFYEQNADDILRAHVTCIDWTERESPARDLLRRIRATRGKLSELDRVLGIAEKIALEIDRAWTRRAEEREKASKLALRYFKLLDRTRAVIRGVVDGW
jgi:hypothetical protein